ncbi:MAG TPA: tetratricopeptide repeat protein [Pyrinomonadaceae bacterium]|nr:tetratricopeptide repeat protein [Pyrinomonadaceae bacterium]
MKRLAYRLAVALLTFFVGVATTMFQSRPQVTSKRSAVTFTAEAPRAAWRCAEVARLPGLAGESRAGSGEASYYLGRAGDELRRAGCFQEAATAYEAAIAADASYAPAYADLSNTYNHLGRYEEAIAVGRRGSKVGDDGDAYLYNEIGYAKKGLSRYADAVEAFRRAVASEPDNAYAHSTLAGAYFRLDRYREALAEAEHGASLADRASDVAALNNAALVIADLRRYDESVAMFQRSLNMDVDHVATPVELGGIYAVSGHDEDASESFARTLSLRPNSPSDYLERGWAHLYLGNEDAAVADARTYLDLTSWRGHDAPYAVFLAYLAYREHGRDAEADGIVGDAATKCDANVWQQNIFRYLQQGMSESELLSAASNNDRMTDAQALVGLDLLFDGNPAKAANYLRWVRDNGASSDIGYPYVVRQLNRINNAHGVSSRP